MTTQHAANSMIIFENHYNKFTEPQVHAWRMNCWDNLGMKKRYTQNEIKSLGDRQYVEIHDNVMENMLAEHLILGGTAEDVVFVTIDSNVICRHSIIAEMKNIHQRTKKVLGKSTLPFVVLVDTYIGFLENDFKYRQLLDGTLKDNTVKQQYLNEYLDVWDGIKQTNANVLHEVSRETASRFLYAEESRLMNNLRRGERVDINDMNDTVQLNLMLHLRDRHPGSNVIILTNDKGMVQKCKNNDVITFSNKKR
jgi:hypothetical protein